MTAPAVPTALERFFELQEARALEPWRVLVAAMRREYDSACSADSDTLLHTFIDVCKAGLLSPDEMLTAQYSLLASDAGRKFYTHLLLTKSASERIKAHNFAVAHDCGEDFTRTHAKTLEVLPWPLFPAQPAFTGLNIKLLAEFGRQREGAGSRGAPTSTLFRAPLFQGGGGHPFRQDKEPLVGAGAVPVANGWKVKLLMQESHGTWRFTLVVSSFWHQAQ